MAGTSLAILEAFKLAAGGPESLVGRERREGRPPKPDEPAVFRRAASEPRLHPYSIWPIAGFPWAGCKQAGACPAKGACQTHHLPRSARMLALASTGLSALGAVPQSPHLAGQTQRTQCTTSLLNTMNLKPPDSCSRIPCWARRSLQPQGLHTTCPCHHAHALVMQPACLLAEAVLECLHNPAALREVTNTCLPSSEVMASPEGCTLAPGRRLTSSTSRPATRATAPSPHQNAPTPSHLLPTVSTVWQRGETALPAELGGHGVSRGLHIGAGPALDQQHQQACHESHRTHRAHSDASDGSAVESPRAVLGCHRPA